MLMRFSRLLLMSVVCLVPVAAVAASGTDKEKLARALADCDAGAAVPLMDGPGRPVHAGDLALLGFKAKAEFDTLLEACTLAAAASPRDDRLQMQWLRLAVINDTKAAAWAVPALTSLANRGVAEARYLLYKIHMRNRADPTAVNPVSAADARRNLEASAGAGHIEALFELTMRYRNGGLFKRDQHKAWETARTYVAAVAADDTVSAEAKKIAADMTARLVAFPLEHEGFSADEQKQAFDALAAQLAAGKPDRNFAFSAYANALRRGLGTKADPAKARAFLEEQAGANPRAIPVLAEMMALGEGGPKDVETAMVLLGLPDLAKDASARRIRAELLINPDVAGFQPQQAIRLMIGDVNLDTVGRLAGLLAAYPQDGSEKERVLALLRDGAEAGESGIGLALARLKLSKNSDYTDLAGARDILLKLVESGEREAVWMLASIQYSALDNPDFRPNRLFGDYGDDELRKLLEDGVAKKEAQAYLLSAKFARSGVVYTQDDKAAFDALVNAANLGNVEAMVRLGDAWEEGIGTAKDPRQRLFAWRMAAAKGSLSARDKLANAFIFDSFDNLMTLDEGITNRIVLEINSRDPVTGKPRGLSIPGIAFNGMFGSQAQKAGSKAVAEAVMNAFREAPAGLTEGFLTGFAKDLPDEIRLAMAERLVADGVLAGRADDDFGPETREALTRWVALKGPYQSIRLPETPDQAKADAKPDDGLDPALVAKVRDEAFAIAAKAKNDKKRKKSIAMLQQLALYGDLDPRWGLLRNYHTSRLVREAVSAADITRYGLDILATAAPGMDKPEFEFIFVVTEIYKSGQIDAFGDAVIAAIRDDKRLQDPLVLGGIVQHFGFAPGACDGLLEAGRRAGIAEMGSDGCDEASRTALIAHAVKAGPTGALPAIRAKAAEAITRLAADIR